jgi:Arc/MetJ-type ribon-helix-helix transcriptional regulator
MKYIGLRLPDQVDLMIDPLVKSRGFKNRSEYIRDLIQRDFDGALAKHSTAVSDPALMKFIKSFQTDSLKHHEINRNEILQRFYILTQISLDILSKTSQPNLNIDQLQERLNIFVANAKDKYPIQE